MKCYFCQSYIIWRTITINAQDVPLCSSCCRDVFNEVSEFAEMYAQRERKALAVREAEYNLLKSYTAKAKRT